jgi:hypothetical protein
MRPILAARCPLHRSLRLLAKETERGRLTGRPRDQCAVGRPVLLPRRIGLALVLGERHRYEEVGISGCMEMYMSKPSENPSGQPIGGLWAKEQKQGVQKQEQAGTAGLLPQLSDEEQKKLEQEVVDEAEQEAGEDATDTPTLAPEKQGGIAGP